MNTTDKWILGGVGAGIAALLGLVIWKEKSTAATAAAPQVPVWAAVTPNSDGSITVPVNSTFAMSMLGSNPNLPALQAAIAAAGQSSPAQITATQGYALGSPPPANWPAADAGGTAAYRATGVVSGTDWIIYAPASTGLSVWTFAGVRA